MKAVRISFASESGERYSESSPAPSSTIHLEDVSLPRATRSGEMVVKVKATTVIRDSLTWSGLYADNPAYLGHDFSGVVAEVFPGDRHFAPGDEVYGMTHADRGGTWAEYVMVNSREAYPKPEQLTWEEAAAVPLSALSADQALFVHAGLDDTFATPKRVLITGAAGGVGMLAVYFASKAGHYVVAATSSNSRNKTFLQSIGAGEVAEYRDLCRQDAFDAIIDTVGGDILQSCWALVHGCGSLVSIDSASWNFVESREDRGLLPADQRPRATFFVVEPSKDSMRRITSVISAQISKHLVAKTVPFILAREAYEMSFSRDIGRGRIVLVF